MVILDGERLRVLPPLLLMAVVLGGPVPAPTDPLECTDVVDGGRAADGGGGVGAAFVIVICWCDCLDVGRSEEEDDSFFVLDLSPSGPPKLPAAEAELFSGLFLFNGSSLFDLEVSTSLGISGC
jgi:hypothetical protein